MTPVLVLGAGSIGRRHARNLAADGAEVHLADPTAPARVPDLAGARLVPWDGVRLDRYPAVVVASPTVHHRDQADAAAAAGARVLVEKPLAATAHEAITLRSRNERIRVGFNLRHHGPVQRLAAMVASGKAGRLVAGRLWFGYHLPSWRPGTDYRSTYSSQAALGGGVLLDAIHELDLAVWLFGRDLRVHSSRLATVGDLDIDAEDTVRALLLTPGDAPVEVALDYLSRRYRRGVEVIGTDATIRLDWARGVLEVEDEDGVRTEPATDPVDRSYRDEDASFLAWVKGDGDLPVDVETALVSLRLADAIRGRST